MANVAQRSSDLDRDLKEVVGVTRWIGFFGIGILTFERLAWPEVPKPR